jgi:hypothetical protein
MRRWIRTWLAIAWALARPERWVECGNCGTKYRATSDVCPWCIGV